PSVRISDINVKDQGHPSVTRRSPRSRSWRMGWVAQPLSTAASSRYGRRKARWTEMCGSHCGVRCAVAGKLTLMPSPSPDENGCAARVISQREAGARVIDRADLMAITTVRERAEGAVVALEALASGGETGDRPPPCI